MKSGNVRRIARTKFYLFDAHPGELLKAAGVQPVDVPHVIDDPNRLVDELSMASHYSTQAESAAFMRAAMPVLKPHVVQEVVTDFDGKATFEPLKPGIYYLWGVAEIGSNWAYWNLKLDLQPKKSLLTLDNNNASSIW